MSGRVATSAQSQCSSKGSLSGCPQNWCRWGENQLGYLRTISVSPSLPAVGSGAAVAVGRRATAGAGDRSNHGEAIVEGAGNESRFAGTRNAGDDQLVFVD